jgi:hypothetical protein
MTSFPAAGYIVDPNRSEGEVQNSLEAWLQACKQLPGGTAESILVIATGTITPTASAHQVDTEAAAAADDLTTIATTNMPEGSIITLRCANASRVVTLKHNTGGAGKIIMIDSADIVLNDVNITVVLQRRGTDWNEIRPVAPATSARKGISELATLAEVVAGTDTERVVTPSTLFGVSAAAAQGKQTIWVPASAIFPRTGAQPCGESETVTATNKIVRKTKDFDSGATNEFGQFSIAFPKSWNKSTLTAQFYWLGGAAGNVIWGIQAVAISNDDPIDVAFGSAVEVTDAFIASTDLHITAETGAITVAGAPANDDEVIFQVYRNSASASDTMTGDARLVGVKLFYTTNAKNDA